MKKLVLFCLFFFSFLSFYGQCPDNYISINSQVDLDSFKTTYPNCTELLKNLSLNGSDITDLSALDEITSIARDLTIKNTGLVNLNGLDNLVSLGDLIIENNENLLNLTGIESLSIIKNISIKYNYNLTSLHGLSNVSEIDEDLSLTNSSALIDISGLSGLNEVGGNFTIGGVGLANFSDLNQLQVVQGDFSITSMLSLTDLSELSALHTVNGVLSIKNHTNLQSITGFPSLVQIGGLDIDNNKYLQSILGLSALQNINGDFILGRYSGSSNTYRFGNDLLEDISGLNSLQVVTGDLLLNGNKVLQQLVGLEQLTTVQGDFELYHNESLLNLDGLQGLQSIGGKLRVRDNNNLLEVNALSGLTTVTGDVEIFRSDVLQSLSGLNELVVVGGDFQIGSEDLTSRSGNEALIEADFTELQSVGGNFLFSLNKVLPNISGFNKLESVGGLMKISHNYEVDEITGFNSLTNVFSSISIAGSDKFKIISGFQQLNSVPTYLTLCGGENFETISGFSNLSNVGTTLTICSSPTLSSLSGFQNLETIQEDFIISNNSYDNNDLIYGGFTNFTSFSKLRSIGGTFEIDKQISLESFDGLQVLETIGDDFIVQTGFLSSDGTYYTSSLTSMQGLSSLKSVGRDMIIQHNSSLLNFEGLQSLESVERYFRISYNHGLENLVGLSALESVNHDFYIGYNNNIKGLTGLESLRSVENILEILANPKLESLVGLDNLESFTTLDIQQNVSLLNLNHLSSLNLEAIENARISISNNEKLTSLTGLEAVTNLDYMVLLSNPQLVSLDGLENLQSLGNLHIQSHLKLNDLSAIENTEIKSGGLLRIQYNPELSECSEKSICNFINTEDRVSILLNDNGCKTKWEILDRCPNPEDFDGDGVLNSIEDADGTDSEDGCSYVTANQDSMLISILWEEADCDNDGILNGDELTNGTNPRKVDTDGDGILDGDDSDPTDACLPQQNKDYTGYDTLNIVWKNNDCDGDTISNGDEVTAGTNPYLNESLYTDSTYPDAFGEQRIETNDGGARAIATNGTTVVAGIRNATGSKVEIYAKNASGVWKKNQELTSPKTTGTTRFGQSLALSENTLIVSQPYDDENLPDTVFIYQKDANETWVETQQIEASSAFTYDGFGSALAVSDNVLVLAAGGIAPSGAVYVFEKNTSNVWVETAELYPSDDLFNGGFGESVAVSGNQIIIGASGYDATGAFIFEKQEDNSWKEVQSLSALDGDNYTYARDVAITENRIIIGDVGYTDITYDQGETIVYEKAYNGIWNEVQTLKASNGYQADYFGDALAMNNNRIVVNMSVDQTDTGWLYVYHKSGGEWTETHILTDPEISTLDFGNHVAVAEGLIVATSGDYVHFFEDASIVIDTDGDGVADSEDNYPNNPCLPSQIATYTEYNVDNEIWATSDCDNDTVSNGEEVLNGTNPYEAETSVSACVEIASSDGAASDYFGKVLAMSDDGNVLAVSAYYDDDLGENSGSVYIFNKTAEGAWEETQKLNALDGGEDESFGFSLTFAGESLAISTYQQDNRTGAVYIYTKSTEGIWQESQKLSASDSALYKQFGYAIAGVENQIIIGAPNDNENGTNAGAAYIFIKGSDGIWAEAEKITASDAEASDSFGISVSIATNIAVVGSFYDDDALDNSGAAYVFDKTINGNWTEVAKLKASDPKIYGGYAVSVANSETDIIVGAASINSNSTDVGAAYVYKKSTEGSWISAEKLTPEDGMAKDKFGLHVAINENRIACGISGDDDNGPSTGSVQLYYKSRNGDWTAYEKLLACNTNEAYAAFGNGLSLANNSIAVGTSLFTATGSANVFELGDIPTETEPLVVQLVQTTSSGCSEVGAIIEATVTGGTEPYIYELYEASSNSLIKSGAINVFENVSMGTYYVKVTDSNSIQELSNSLSITESEAISAMVTVNDISCEGYDNGSISIQALGGFAPLQYSIGGGEFYSEPNFENLASGTYDVVIQDTNGCTFHLSASIAKETGCSNFTLPANNFTIETTGESCASSNNGSIVVSALEKLDYTATLSGGMVNESKVFETFTSFKNLQAGSYDVCLTVAGEDDFEKCFTIQITEPDTLKVDSKTDATGKLVSLSLKGSSSYFITVNEKEYSTTENEITLPLSENENNITVKTDLECQGVFEKTIMATTEHVSIFPNPIEKGDVSIFLPTINADQEILITMFSQSAIRVLEQMKKADGRIVKINMDNLPTGVYTIIVTSESQNSTHKIIKK
ncbi:T9SS type A sorting domain-containing protein [Zobellia nedashkovskayae]|uniref:T9SS type A sorting domain-containing protein n=1 Tax=Zobellia nedashkovskayae TaxID=2779510 RepID=UPI00188D915E|nr:T9SS type A sorting domain-containing protein [Zobellia nedashkovskayae]